MPIHSPHLARLGSQARPTGATGAAEARRYCADVLGSLGFVVSEQSFEYSKFPGAAATPLAGVLVPAVTSALYATRSASAEWFAATGVALAFLAGVGLWVGRSGVLGFPLMRRRGVNLEAVRRGDAPDVWLTAHLDSKWQPVSMIARVAGVIGTSAGVVALVVAALVYPRGAPFALTLLWLGSIPLVLSVVGARNHGALDNASGVAAVLEAVALVPATVPVGIVITDSEELGLAGARAWAKAGAATRPPGVALNCDSIDDEGPLVLMYTKTLPRDVIGAMQAAAVAHGEPVRTLHLIPGILTDSVALADAGWRTVTLSRGTLRTLQRIHTSRDTLAHMDGRGIAGAARVLASATMALTAVERTSIGLTSRE